MNETERIAVIDECLAAWVDMHCPYLRARDPDAIENLYTMIVMVIGHFLNAKKELPSHDGK